MEGLVRMTAYRALTGIDYRSSSGEWARVEQGGKISDMEESAARHELEAENIEPWSKRGEQKPKEASVRTEAEETSAPDTDSSADQEA
jgi:hypothetical protein